MNRMRNLVAAGALLLVAGCSNQAQTSAPPANAAATAPDLDAAKTEVTSFIEQYNGYYSANDLDHYFQSFAPDLTQWWPTGRVDLPTYETMWRKLVADGGGNSKAVVTDLQVQVSPDADSAIATYILEVTPRRNGKAETTVERNQETDVLFRRNGEWKVVHVNYGPAAPEKKAS